MRKTVITVLLGLLMFGMLAGPALAGDEGYVDLRAAARVKR